MKTKTAVLMLVLLLGGAAVAQQVTLNATNQSAPTKELRNVLVAAGDASASEDSVGVSKVLVTMPPLKLLRSPGPAARRVEPGSRAWNTLAGWYPGTSAFADPMTHESKCVLLTSRPGKQR